MYIGKTPALGNYQKCDAITTSATATYNLVVGGVATSPETANNCIVSLNGVIQAPGASGGFTISGSQIIFNSALTSADVIDFILILGDVLDIGTVSNDTITNAKMADDAVGIAELSATGTASSSTFLRGDNSWASAGGGAWERLSTDTISSGVTNFTRDNVFSATYKVYKLMYHGVNLSAAGYLEFQFLTGGDGTVASGSSYHTKYQFMYNAITSSAHSDGNTSATSGFRFTGTYAREVQDNYEQVGDITLYNPFDNSYYNTFQGWVTNQRTSHYDRFQLYGAYNGAKISATGFKISVNTGNIDEGEFVLLGMKRA